MAPPPEPLLECDELPPDEELLPLPVEEEVAFVEFEDAVSLLVVPLVEVEASVSVEFAVLDVASVVFRVVLCELELVFVSLWLLVEALVVIFEFVSMSLSFKVCENVVALVDKDELLSVSSDELVTLSCEFAPRL